MSPHPAIGLIAPQLSGLYFGSLLASIRATVKARGYGLLAFQGTPHDLLESRVGLSYIAGWIVINTTHELARLVGSGAPVVTIGAHMPDLACPAVLPDNRGGMQVAVQHLIEHGHRQIAFVGNLENFDIQQRYDGYLAALTAAGIEPDPRLLVRVDDNSEQSGAAALERLARSGMVCTAIACATDENALGLQAAAIAANYKVPDQLAVIGFDDIVLAHSAVPPLSTVRVSLQALGGAAAQLLLDLIAGRPAPTTTVQVPTTLIPRRSCGCGTFDHQLELSTIISAPDWQEACIYQLIRLMNAPFPVDPRSSYRELWPGAATLVSALAGAIDGRTDPPSVELFLAWQQAVLIAQGLETMLAMVRILEEVGAWQLAARADDPGARARVVGLIDNARLELMRACMAPENSFVRSYSALVQQNYAISIRLMRSVVGSARQLQWLQGTPFNWGCLGLWSDETSLGRKPRLVVAGSYGPNQQALLAASAGASLAPEVFPPLLLPSEPADGSELDVVAVLPIRSAERDWGVLALGGPIEYLRSSGNYDTLSAYGAQLSAALERDTLESALRESYEQAQSLAQTVRELSSPIIPLLPGVLLVPLIGTIDAQRSQQLSDHLLEQVGALQARTILLDVTGVPLVDTQAAAAIVQLAQAARLLGARTTLVGVRPEIAQSIVSLGIDLQHIDTQASLATALAALHTGRAPDNR